MNRSLTQLNTTTNTDNPISAIVKAVLNLFCFLFLMLNYNPISAQSNNCPNGDPLQWAWIQNLLEQSAGCVVGSLRQFEYNGDTFIAAVQGVYENGYPCAADHNSSYYSCTGQFICSDGVFGTGCDPNFRSSAFNTSSTVIWTFTDECLPFNWGWQDDLTQNSGGCDVGQITRIKYKGNYYYMTTPATSANGVSCPVGSTKFYNCRGDLLCEFTSALTPQYLQLCDPDFFSGTIKSTNVWWTYSENTGNPPTPPPFSACTDEIATNYNPNATQDDGSCEYGTSGNCNTYLGTFFYSDCGGINYYFIELENGRIFDPYFAVDPGYYPEEGQQIRFDFEIKTDVTTPCTISESPITITCFEEIEPNYDCPTSNPLNRRWIQEIIDNADGCAFNEIRQFSYEGSTYFHALPEQTGYYFCENGVSNDNPEYFYDCFGNIICFGGIGPPCDLPDLVAAGLHNYTTIWTYEVENNESTCDLPLDQGTCDEFIPRYYFNAEAGTCQPFIYTGCDGNANNYETYNDCMNVCNPTISCQDGDPLEWDWIQNIIENSDGCATGKITQFERDGSYYFEIGIGTPCLNYDPLYNRFYDCHGNLICIVGLFPPGFPPICNAEFFEGAQNRTTIWTYEYDCSDPFETSIVQNAMLEECTEAIYTIDYEDDPYIYIKKGCDYSDVIYNCKTTQSCGINSSGGIYACPSLIESVQPLLNEANAIWTNDCTYETTGTVYYAENCGLYIGCCLDSQFQIVTLPEGVELELGQIVEFSYEWATDEICLPLGMPVDITCIRTVANDCGCPPVAKPSTLVCGLDGNTYNNDCLANCYGGGVAYEGECRDCNMDNPLEESWMKELIITGEGCTVYEIGQFQYNGDTYFEVWPNSSCVSDLFVRYYDCFGNSICSSSILSGNSCDPGLSAAANSANTIWTYNETGCTNPLQTDFVQNWLNNDCQPEAIYSLEFEGETFIYVEPGVYCYDYYFDEADLFYNCNAGITCNLTSAFLGYYDFYCFNISELYLTSQLNSDNLIWTKSCEYETTGEVINIGDYIPAEYVYDEDCDLVINLPSIGFVVSPIALPDGFNLTEGQIVEFTYLHTYGYPSSACSDVAPVEVICIREAGDNQNNMDRIECPPNHITSICAPVTMPPSLTMQDFSTSIDPTYMNSMSMQMQEQTEVYPYFNTTTRTYIISDESGNQKTCETKHHIVNQFLQMPAVSNPGVICEEDLWSYVKIGTDQYTLYSDHNGTKGNLMSICNTPSLVCSTADLNVDTKLPDTYHFWASTYFEFPDGSICESEAMPFYVDVKPKPVAQLSTQNKTVSNGEGFELMDMVSTNQSGYWSGENISYLMTVTGENIAYFSANTVGTYKLYYTVKNDFCERSYLLVINVEPINENCTVDDPFSIPIIQQSVDQYFTGTYGHLCSYIDKIIQFQYEGSTYFRVDPIGVSAPQCQSYHDSNRFYDCQGALIGGGRWGFQDCPDVDFCNSIADASNEGDVIWSFEIDPDCSAEDPFSIPFIQQAINKELFINNNGDTCNHINTIIQFQYEGSTYFRFNKPGGITCSPLYGDEIYNCRGILVGGAGVFNYCYPFACDVIYDVSDTGTVIWSSEGDYARQESKHIPQFYKTTSFNIYPNPTSNKVFIDLPDKAVYQISLTDISGKMMKQLKTEQDESIIEMKVNDLPKGMYLVEVKNETSHHIQKLIIE